MNGYPLLYPDSVQYVTDGHSVLHSLLHGPNPNLGGMRSPLYSLLILPWHLNRTPWPVVVLQALLVAYVLWMVVRTFLAPRACLARRTSLAPIAHWLHLRYVVLVVVLSAATSVSWYVSLLMPDILGASAYLCILLLVFARERFSRMELGALVAIAVLGMTAHLTHLLLGALLCIALVVLFACLRRGVMRGEGRGVALAVLALLLAFAAQIGVNARVSGQARISVKRVPYLTARLVADGPARRYLESHCPAVGWAICSRVHDLPDNDDAFLWDPDGVWGAADPAMQEAMRREEIPLALATLRTYPRELIASELHNFLAQLIDFGVDDFDTNQWMEGALDSAMPGAHARYQRSLQARNVVPSGVFTTLHQIVVVGSLLALAVLAPWLWRRRRQPQALLLLWMGVLLTPLLEANALSTGALSEVDSRYQARVIWLLPLLAALTVMSWWRERSLVHGEPDRE
jgi:hypothetical protein